MAYCTCRECIRVLCGDIETAVQMSLRQLWLLPTLALAHIHELKAQVQILVVSFCFSRSVRSSSLLDWLSPSPSLSLSPSLSRLLCRTICVAFKAVLLARFEIQIQDASRRNDLDGEGARGEWVKQSSALKTMCWSS